MHSDRQKYYCSVTSSSVGVNFVSLGQDDITTCHDEASGVCHQSTLTSYHLLVLDQCQFCLLYFTYLKTAGLDCAVFNVPSNTV